MTVVTARPLDHLEEHLAHRGGVEVHELSAGLAVVEETELMQLGDGFGAEVEPGDQVVVVVVRAVRNSSPRSRAARARSRMRYVLKATCWGSPELCKTGGAMFSGTRIETHSRSA